MRWPLKVHFFAEDVFQAWNRWCQAANERLRASLPVVTDFEKDAVERTVREWFGVHGSSVPMEEGEGTGNQLVTTKGKEKAKVEMAVATVPPAWGIYTLPVDYEPIKEYVAKGKDIFEFEQLGNCVVCHQKLDSDTGLHAVCTNPGCEGVGHLSCWSRHLLSSDDTAESSSLGRGKSIIPIHGTCPSCGGEVQWGDMMKELSLRMRGSKEVDKLLKIKKKRATRKPKIAATA